MVVWWLALLPHSWNFPGLETPQGPCACVGYLWVLCSPPQSENIYVCLIDESKLSKQLCAVVPL